MKVKLITHLSNLLFCLLITTISSKMALAENAKSRVDTITYKRSLKSERKEARKRLAILKRAIKYFDRNEDKIKNHMSLKVYQEIREAVLKGSIDDLDIKNKMVKVGDSTRTLLSEISILESLGQSLKDSQDTDNLLKQYKSLYNLLPSRRQKKMAHPDYLELTSAKKLQQANKKLIRILKKVSAKAKKKNSSSRKSKSSSKPSGYQEDCDKEFGSAASAGYSEVADGSDRCDDTNCTHDPDGLYANASSSDFPLKYYNTCIKDQGRRGTCASFAINAAVETLTYFDTGMAVNLSEQFTYAHAETLLMSSRYEDGINTSNGLSKLISDDIALQLEYKWYYNPSRGRTEKEPNGDNEYPGSCTDYLGQMCTNYAFQCEENIETISSVTYFTYEMPVSSSTYDWKVTDKTSILTADMNYSLDHAIQLLQNEEPVPVIVGFTVTPGFMKVDSKGYVRWDSMDMYDPTNRETPFTGGGHATVLVGYVANDDLPSGVKDAEGDGFFIMKNSWGTDRGDLGYLYVDYDFLKNQATQLLIIEYSRSSADIEYSAGEIEITEVAGHADTNPSYSSHSIEKKFRGSFRVKVENNDSISSSLAILSTTSSDATDSSTTISPLDVAEAEYNDFSFTFQANTDGSFPTQSLLWRLHNSTVDDVHMIDVGPDYAAYIGVTSVSSSSSSRSLAGSKKARIVCRAKNIGNAPAGVKSEIKLYRMDGPVSTLLKTKEIDSLEVDDRDILIYRLSYNVLLEDELSVKCLVNNSRVFEETDFSNNRASQILIE